MKSQLEKRFAETISPTLRAISPHSQSGITLLVMTLFVVVSNSLLAQNIELIRMPLRRLEAEAREGHPSAILQRWIRTRFGMGVPIEYNQGKMDVMIQQAADAGSEAALGYCLIKGIGRTKDIKAGFAALSKAHAEGDLFATRWLAMCYAGGAACEKDLELASKLLEKAATAGEVGAMFNLAELLLEQSSQNYNPDRALALYSQGSLKSSMMMEALGDLHMNGRGTTVNQALANECYRLAGEMGCGNAFYKLGYNCEIGRGVPRSYDMTDRYYQWAADLGITNAADAVQGRLRQTGRLPGERLAPQFPKMWTEEDRPWLVEATGRGDVSAAQALQRLGPPAPVYGAFLALLPGVTAPGDDAGADERFLHQLSRITTRYLLDTAYMPSSGHTFHDLDWAAWRAQSLALLLNSDMADGVSSGLKDLCSAALQTDALFMQVLDLEFPKRRGDDPARPFLGFVGNSLLAMAADMQADAGRATQPWLYQSVPPSRSLQRVTGSFMAETLLPAMARHDAALNLRKEAMSFKEEKHLHDRWREMLESLAEKNSVLHAYARNSRMTDPFWHFAAQRDFGEMYFGECVTSRGAGERSALRDQAADLRPGDPSSRPILIRISSRGKGWCFRVNDRDGPRTDRAYVLSCTKGHVGMKFGPFIGLWAAEGLNDWRLAGRVEHGSHSPFAPEISHMPVTEGAAADEVEATLLIYVRGEFKSDSEAREAAREVNLF